MLATGLPAYSWFMESPHGFDTVHWDQEPVGGTPSFGVPPSGGTDRLKPGHQTGGSWSGHVFLNVQWDHEPAWETQSAAGAAHSKTWRKFEDSGQRVSVLEYGGVPPLSMRARPRDF